MGDETPPAFAGFPISPPPPIPITLLANGVNPRRSFADSIVCNVYRTNNDPKQMGANKKQK